MRRQVQMVPEKLKMEHILNFKVNISYVIYAPMIYTAPCLMFLMRADPLREQVGGDWAPDPSSPSKYSKKNLDSYCFVTSLTFYLRKMM